MGFAAEKISLFFRASGAYTSGALLKKDTSEDFSALLLFVLYTYIISVMSEN